MSPSLQEDLILIWSISMAQKFYTHLLFELWLLLSGGSSNPLPIQGMPQHFILQRKNYIIQTLLI